MNKVMLNDLKQDLLSNAVLNGIVKEELYMRQPEDFEKGENLVCKLNKSFYGLKQAPYYWNKRFNQLIEVQGLVSELV